MTFRSPAQEPDSFIRQQQRGYLAQALSLPVPEYFHAGLYLAVADWLGVPYRYAGTTIRGIDCSAFVRKVFSYAYGIDLDGNSRNMFQATRRIHLKQLQQGDLVFFKTNRRGISHVGIYLGNNKFAHSSRSRGVTVTDLDSPWFLKRYAGAGRLPDGPGRSLAASD